MENKIYVGGANDLRMGCDPEFFFSTKTGTVIGSEKVLKKEGQAFYGGTIVIDGVQAELNPRAEFCRQNIGRNIAEGMANIKSLIAAKGVEAKFSTAVEVSKEELETLSAGSKTFGCAPSKNLNKDIEGKITVNPVTYKYRSAGGHIHLGKENYKEYTTNDVIMVEGFSNDITRPFKSEEEFGAKFSHYYKNGKAVDNPDKLVPLLDAILGNTAVLVDRDPMNKERRKVYGKAGEFRTPRIADGKPYDGLEYRTLSNFWLKSYPLMSMAFVLARTAVHVLAYSTPENNFADMVLGAVDRNKIVEAINENKYSLAYNNFMKVQAIMTKITNPQDPYSPFAARRVKPFKYFLRRNPDQWFDKDPIVNWTQKKGNGFEFFLEKEVSTKMKEPMQKVLQAIGI